MIQGRASGGLVVRPRWTGVAAGLAVAVAVWLTGCVQQSAGGWAQMTPAINPTPVDSTEVAFLPPASASAEIN